MEIHPLSAKGKYYVDVETCTWCGMCEVEAPENFKLSVNYEGAYVFKQPETSQEEEQCMSALDCCPHLAILGDGKIKNIKNFD